MCKWRHVGMGNKELGTRDSVGTIFQGVKIDSATAVSHRVISVT